MEVRNFAKRKMAGLKDDVHADDWGPHSDGSLKDYLTGYYGALQDLERWVLESIDGK